MDDERAFSDPRLVDVAFRPIRHRRVGSLEEAAVLRGVNPSAIIKTIVVRRADDDYLFVLVPGNRVIDWPKLRSHLGQRRLSMPEPDEAFRVTGYAPGTITPFGAARNWPVVADHNVDGIEVSIGMGAPGVAMAIDGSTLVEILNAEFADVTRERDQR